MAMDKGKLHYRWRQLKRIKIWQLLIAVVVLSALSGYLLRQNSLGMIARRKAVVAADEKNGDVEKSLIELRSYMMRHMNTRMSEPLQLKSSYERAVQQQVDAAAKSGNVNDTAAYQRAQTECRTSNTVTYAQCVIDKTSQVAPGADPVTQIAPPPVELFSYQFYTPVWSPDLAGFAVLLLFLTLLLLIVRVVGERIAWLILRRHH